MGRRELNRAEFLKLIGASAAGAVFLPGAESLLNAVAPDDEAAAAAARAYPYISVARGHALTASHVAAVTRAAIRNLGGLGRFVHSGDVVVVKPNIYGPRTPAQACTTNPTVVATIVRDCLRAGAARVSVMDNSCGGGDLESFKTSGLYAAVRNAGGRAVIMSAANFRSYSIPNGRSITSWRIYKDMIDCDVLIDVPIAKVHGATRVTLACKNLMGCCDDMGQLHNSLSQRIADILSRIRPDLTVIDGIRVRVANGPGGTSLADVRKRYTVIASADPVAADAYASLNLLGIRAAGSPGVAHLKNAAAMGLGKVTLTGLTVKKVTL